MSFTSSPESTLKRVRHTGQKTYIRTLERQIDWPSGVQGQRSPVQSDPPVYTSLDDAFSSVIQSMSQISRQCKRYYKSNPPKDQSSPDACHCNRFHKNPKCSLGDPQSDSKKSCQKHGCQGPRTFVKYDCSECLKNLLYHLSLISAIHC